MFLRIKSFFYKISSNTFLFLLLLSVFSVFSLFMQKYLVNGQDLMFHFTRIEGIVDNIQAGNWFNGIYYNQLNGYGIATPLFYPDFFLYIPALLIVIFGVTKYTAYKIFLLGICFFSELTMYLSVKNIAGSKKAAYLATILYASSSYRYTDMIERAALGESLAFIFLPLVFWGIYEIIYHNQNKYWILTIGMSGLLLSHLITSVFAAILLLIICLFNFKRLFKEKNRLLKLLLAALFAVLVTSYFILPLIEQLFSQKFSLSYIMQSTEGMEFFRLFRVIPGNVYLNEYGGENWLPAGLGITFFGVLLISFIGVFSKAKNNTFGIVTLALSVLCLWFSTNLFPFNSSVINEMFSFMQFRWRSLAFSTVLAFLSFGITYANSKVLHHAWFTVLIFISILPVIYTFNYYNYAFAHTQSTVGNDTESLGYGEYLPVSQNLPVGGSEQLAYYYNKESIATSSDEDLLLETIRSKNHLTVNYENNKNASESEILLPLIYYKGYTLKLNDIVIPYEKSDDGLIKVKTKAEPSGTITAYYTGTHLAITAKWISILGTALFSIWNFHRKAL